MEKQIIVADKSIVTKITELEKDVIRQLLIATYSGQQNDVNTSTLNNAIHSYFNEFLLNGTHMQYRVKSLIRLLRFLMRFPVKKKIDMSFTKKLYMEHSLINLTTYHLSQFTSEPFCSSTIDEFMNYMHKSDKEHMCIFYMYRVNPIHVKKTYQIDNIDILSPSELYTGITSGYFSMKNGSCKALNRLFAIAQLSNDEVINYSHQTNKSYENNSVELTKSQFLAIKFINMLISDGYYINVSI